MINKPDLTPDFCLQVVVNSTPFPDRFNSGTDDPTAVALFDLGVVNAIEAANFVQNVKNNIAPWQIDGGKVASSRDTTLQTAALSVQANAF